MATYLKEFTREHTFYPKEAVYPNYSAVSPHLGIHRRL